MLFITDYVRYLDKITTLAKVQPERGRLLISMSCYLEDLSRLLCGSCLWPIVISTGIPFSLVIVRFIYTTVWFPLSNLSPKFFVYMTVACIIGRHFKINGHVQECKAGVLWDSIDTSFIPYSDACLWQLPAPAQHSLVGSDEVWQSQPEEYQDHSPDRKWWKDICLPHNGNCSVV